MTKIEEFSNIELIENYNKIKMIKGMIEIEIKRRVREGEMKNIFKTSYPLLLPFDRKKNFHDLRIMI